MTTSASDAARAQARLEFDLPLLATELEGQSPSGDSEAPHEPPALETSFIGDADNTNRSTHSSRSSSRSSFRPSVSERRVDGEVANDEMPLIEVTLDLRPETTVAELADLSLDALPPLPKPDTARMQLEARRGIITVASIIVVCLVIAHLAMAFSETPISDILTRVALGLVYLEAFVAIFCLVRILTVDPGVVRRDALTCLPFPKGEIGDRLRAKQSLDGLTRANVIDPHRGVYCVRCLVWRPMPQEGSKTCCTQSSSSGGTTHHCSTCGRCVARFDHHCSVFGRCIAGKGWIGNIIYFYTIIGAGCAGGCTALTSAAISIGATGGVKGIGIAVGVIAGIFVVWGLCSSLTHLIYWRWRLNFDRAPMPGHQSCSCQRCSQPGCRSTSGSDCCNRSAGRSSMLPMPTA
jgi:hypothetical protein